VATVSLTGVVSGQFAHPLNLEIPDGRFAVITGPGGSGKSNVLRTIAGLEKVSSGEIRIDGRRVNDLAPKDRDVAMVFAHDSLYPLMTIRENIVFGLKRRRFAATEMKKRVEEAATILALGDLLEQKPAKLSLAQRQRAAIARAVVRQPKVLLFDHALMHLADQESAHLGKEIAMLHERLRATTLFATSDVHETLSMAEVIAVFDGGAVQAFDTPRALLEQPASIFVAKFLGRPPMNFIRGDLKEDRGRLRFHEAESGTLQFDLPNPERFGVRSEKLILLGVRPGDIEQAEFARQTEGVYARFRAITEWVSPLSDGTDIYFHTGAHAGICRSGGWLEREKAVGRRMEFVINLEKAHFFDEMSGKRIV
jgi:multiple sugar transport system ATP-binding protein